MKIRIVSLGRESPWPICFRRTPIHRAALCEILAASRCNRVPRTLANLISHHFLSNQADFSLGNESGARNRSRESYRVWVPGHGRALPPLRIACRRMWVYVIRRVGQPKWKSLEKILEISRHERENYDD